MIKVSVITVVFNAEKTIERTIQSIINQSYQNLEYIIIDGNSTDNTVNIINNYIDKITYFSSEKDNGIYDAMNKGIKVSTGDLIGLVNADDWLEEDIIGRIVKDYSADHHIDIIHGNINYIKEGETKVYKPRFNKSTFLWYGMGFYHPTFFVNKNVYKNILYDTSYKLVSDYKFTLECFKRNYKFHYIDQVITNFSAGGAGTVFWQRIVEGHQIRKEYDYNIVLIYCSTLFRILKTYASFIKNYRRYLK